MRESEEGELVGSGSFGLDKEAARRKLGADRLKIWKHRIAVISKEFAEILWILGGVLVATSGAAYGYIFGDCRYLDTFSALFLMSAYSIAGIVLMLAALFVLYLVCSAGIYIYCYFEPRLRKIRANWYPEVLSERIGKD